MISTNIVLERILLSLETCLSVKETFPKSLYIYSNLFKRFELYVITPNDKHNHYYSRTHHSRTRQLLH